jgi:arylsulfatase A-like enzyme
MEAGMNRNRREFLKTTAAGLVAAASARARAAAAHAGAVGAAGKPPPNIVLIISDDHGWTDYGFMGHPHIQTPRIDRLARESVTFRRGYVPVPLCCASLASIITGRYAHQHGVVCNDPPGWPADKSGRDRLVGFIERQPALPRILGQHGYASFQAGKWWLGHHSAGGFSHGMTHGDITRGGRHGDLGLQIGRKTMAPVLDFMEDCARRRQPFMMWYAPMLPHAPHNPPQRLLDKYIDKAPSLPIARYWAMIEWFDESCGQVLDSLQALGIADNTIVLYVADNGIAYTVEGREQRSKREPYELGIRTPMMVRWPGRAAPGMSDTQVRALDVYSTALAALGLERPADVPGINLLDPAAVASRGAVFGSAFEHTAVTLDDPAANLQCRYIIDGPWKLIAWFDPKQNTTTRRELFNVVDDPAETRDLAAGRSDKVGELEAKLDGWWRARASG